MQNNTDNKIELILIRHGIAKGNDEHRYIGCNSDVDLIPEGIEGLNNNKQCYKHVDMVFSSPMKRCLHTANIIYPEYKPVIIDGLKEMDFGDFEGKNYQELNGNPEYQAYIDSGGTSPFPNGDSMEGYEKKVITALDELRSIAKRNNAKVVAAVVHGGTVMAVSHALNLGGYFDGIIDNGSTKTVWI